MRLYRDRFQPAWPRVELRHASALSRHRIVLKTRSICSVIPSSVPPPSRRLLLTTHRFRNDGIRRATRVPQPWLETEFLMKQLWFSNLVAPPRCDLRMQT